MENQTWLTPRSFDGIRVDHRFSFLRCVVFLCFVCIRTVFSVPNVASHCPFGFL
jgi:hypothetical protein